MRKKYIKIGSIVYFICLMHSVHAMSVDHRIACYRQQPDSLPLIEAVQLIESEYQLKFSFDPAVVDKIFVNNINTSEPLEIILERISQESNLEVEKVSERFVIIKKKKEVQNSKPKRIKVKGHVTDFEGKTPIPYVSVYFKNSKKGKISNGKGEFEVEFTENSSDTLVFYSLGYAECFIPLASFRSDSAIQIELKTTNYQIQDVIISDFVLQGFDVKPTENRILIKPKETSSIPGPSEGDVFQMIKFLPGIVGVDESVTKLSIRGGTPEQNLVLWNGIPRYSTGHLFGVISSFNKYVIDSVKVYRGDFGPEYWGCIAGVIDMQNSSTIPTTISGNFGADMIQLNSSVTLPLKEKFVVQVAGKRSHNTLSRLSFYNKLSDLYAIDADEISDDYSQQVDAEFYDFISRLYYSSGAVSLSVNYITGSDELIYNSEFQSDQPDKPEDSFSDVSKYKNNGISSILDLKINNDLNSQTIISYSTNYTENGNNNTFMDDSTIYSSIFSEVLLEDLKVSSSLDYNWIPTMKIISGFEYRNLYSREENYNKENNHYLDYQYFTSKAQYASLYLNTKKSFRNKITSAFGYRTNLELNELILLHDIRLSLSYNFLRNFYLTIAGGKYNQIVTQEIDFDNIALNKSVWRVPQIKEGEIVNSESISASAQFLKPKYQMELVLYYRIVSGLNSNIQNFVGSEYEFDFKDGESMNKGIELFLRRRFDRLNTMMSYSYSSSELKIINDEDNIILNVLSPYDQTHKLGIAMQYNFTKGLSLSTKFRYYTGKPYTEAFDISYDPEQDEDYIVFGGINAKRFRSQHQLDLSIHYKREISEQIKGTLYFSALNIYNRKNVRDIKYAISYDDAMPELQTFYYYMMPRLFNFGINIEW